MIHQEVMPVPPELVPQEFGRIYILPNRESPPPPARALPIPSAFWRRSLILLPQMEVLEIGTEQDFKNHNDLPLARIKRIMKCDEDVRMISAEAPVLFAKACEMFILELTLRYCLHCYAYRGAAAA